MSATVLDRLLAAGISEARARAHLEAGRVRVDGVTVTDPTAPVARPARVVLHPGPPDDPGGDQRLAKETAA